MASFHDRARAKDAHGRRWIGVLGRAMQPAWLPWRAGSVFHSAPHALARAWPRTRSSDARSRRMAQRVRRRRPADRRARGAPDHDRHEGRGRPSPRCRRARALCHRARARGQPAPRRRPPQRVHGRRGRRRPAADRVRGPQRRPGADRGRRAPGRRDARRDQAGRGQAARRGVQRDHPGRGRARDRHRHAGIMVLDEGLEPGTPLADVLPITTDVLELEVTPNRPDCLAVYGVAREVHAATALRWPRPRGRRTSAPPARSRASRSSSRPPTCARASPREPSRT